ncbi:GHMP kinase [Thermodesulfobacteriota bacterium]
MSDRDRARPLRVINSRAPIRICDNGGWTDTWFARHGRVFNIGVHPCADVQIEVSRIDGREDRIVIHAENFGERYTVRSGAPGWGRHPLLEAAIERMGVPEETAIDVTIFSEAPSGASTGTSAAVTVALIGALDRLTPGHLSPQEAAATAQSVEVDMLGQQCGIQDQLCSAFGGINYIEMSGYPRAEVIPILPADSIWWELERRLVLVYLGKSHSSSAVHEKVIEELEKAGPDCAALDKLRSTAGPARDAVLAGDFEALGRSMVRNTDAQGRLHPDLVGRDARKVIEIARAHGAPGWKVNGAGGEGGSVTILCGPLSAVKRAMIREIEQENPLYRNILIRLSRGGLCTWERGALS